MDIQTFLQNLHEEVCCSICMTKFTDPKQLPCLHSFCLHCLQRIQETSGIRETILCPECRQDFRIPGGGDLNTLPTNFRINSLLDVLAIKECNTSDVKCVNCGKKSGKCSYCFQCCSFWCDDCLPLHNGIRANKEHHALALKDFQDEDFENILKQPKFCSNKGHENKELEFYCERCEVAICYSCVATLHDGHPKILLDEAANDRKMRANAAINSRKQKLLQKRNKMVRLQNSRVNIQAQVQRVKQNAQEFADKIIAAIEAKKQDIFGDAEAKGNELLEHLMIQLSEEEKDAKRIESSIERTETLLKRSTSTDIVRLDKTLFETNSHAEEEQVSRDLEGQHQFIFDENKALLSKTNTEGIGTFRTSFLSKTLRDQSSVSGKGISECEEIYIGVETGIVVTKRNAKGEQCYEERDCVTMEIRNRQGHDCATIEQLQDNKDGTYKINYFAKETGACQASVKVNGEHVHGSPFEVQVQPRQYKPVISFGQLGSAAGMFNSPWGLAVNKKNEIVVTDTANHRMQIFDSDGHLLRSIGRKGSQQGELNWPAGIVFHNNDIIVADSGNNFIQLFTDQGEYVGQFGGYGSLDHQLKCPNGLSVDSSGNIIVADLGNKLIKIFSPDGHFLFKIGTEGSFVKPIHCIQHGNYFIVSDCGGHCVHVFNKEGKFLYKFGKKGNGDGEFNSPFFLSVSKADHLLVCDSGNHRVQVFEVGGKFLTKFGTESNNIGSLNGPVSTAVLHDGRIVLADVYNHHIQIFQ